MIRIFRLLSASLIALVFIACACFYWVATAEIDKIKFESTQTLARGVAKNISKQISTLQNSVNAIAASKEVIVAIDSKNPRYTAQTAHKLQQRLPKSLKVRILPANIKIGVQGVMPHMGNADFLMVKETLLEPQLPIIQGVGINRHLAITAAIKKQGVSIGVIFATQKMDFLQSHLDQYQGKEVGYALKQKNILLASSGNVVAEKDVDSVIFIPQTPWAIHYWVTSTTDWYRLGIFLAVAFFSSLLAGFICYLGYQKLSKVLTEDKKSILKALKELAINKNPTSHPVQLVELRPITPAIVKLKQALGKNKNDIGAQDNQAEKKRDVDHHANESDVFVSQEKRNGPADKTNSSIFRACDIRGITGKTLSKEVVFNIGRAVGSEAKEKGIKMLVLGRDGRTSSPSLAKYFTKGVLSTGTSIINLGLVPTPIVYFAIQHIKGKSGVVITGSHNPEKYNGLKITLNDESLAGDKIKQLEQRINNNHYLTGELGTVKQNKTGATQYISLISDDIHIARPMKVVVDCGNGAAGKLAPLLLKTLGCEVVELFCDIDGTFPNHHPDPSKPENLSDLIKAVFHHKADIGIAFDGDGDRLGVVDCKGKIIWPDRLLMLFAKDILESTPGAQIIYDVKCSANLGKQIVKNSGRPLMYKTGHSFIKKKLKETGAILAGELSGHIFFNDRWFGFDDALYTASRLIEILSADTRDSDQVFADFPDSINTPELTIKLEEGENIPLMKKILSVASFHDGNIITIDGMRVDFQDGWGIIRASNTMPALVLRFEADNGNALKRIQAQFKELLVKVNPALAIPF